MQSHLASQLRRCRSLLDGRRLHSLILEAGLQKDVYLGNLLVQMYSSCGSLEDARIAFDSLQNPNIYSWNLMVAAYAQRGFLQEGVLLLRQSPETDTVSWNTVITAYAQMGHVAEARDLFDRMPRKDVISWNTLMKGYVRCGSLDVARDMFERIPQRSTISSNIMLAAFAQEGHFQDVELLFNVMPQRSVVSWNALISANFGEAEVARQAFERMPQHSSASWNSIVAAYAARGQPEKAKLLLCMSPEQDVVAWTAVISSHCEIGSLNEAKALFDELVHGKDIVVWNGLLHGYSQNGTDDARSLFCKMPSWDVVSWNSVVSGYARRGNISEALQVFQQMPERNVVSWNTLLSADVSAVQARALFQKMPCHDTVSWNLIVMVNAQAGNFEEAQLMYESMPLRTAVSQTLMLVAYAEAGLIARAKGVFDSMDGSFMVSAHEEPYLLGMLDACASVSAVAEPNNAAVLHRKIIDLTAANAHGRSGAPLFHRDAVSWTAMLTCYARNGHGKDAFQVFATMLLQGLEPNEVTFVSILSACSHAGLVNDGCHYFISLQENFGLTPGAQHYACLIDMFARAGQIQLVERMLKNIEADQDVASTTVLRVFFEELIA